MGRKKQVEGTCEICGHPFDAYCSYYHDRKWIDGRTHAVICHVCYDVPKVHEYDERFGLWTVVPFSPDRVRTVQEMVDDGWDKEEATRSVKAVKAAIKNGKPRSK